MDPCAVTVAPDYPDSIRTDERDRDGSNVGRNRAGVEQPTATHFLDALRAGAGETEIPCRIEV
jgi:hypothetical protein